MNWKLKIYIYVYIDRIIEYWNFRSLSSYLGEYLVEVFVFFLDSISLGGFRIFSSVG